MPEEQEKTEKEQEVKQEEKEKPEVESIIKLENYPIPKENYASLVHKHTGKDTPRISYNDLLDLPSSNGNVIQGSFTSNVNITGLDGDNDGGYILVIRANHSSSFQVAIRFNEDSGSNYYNLRHYVSKQDANVYHNYENITGDDGIIPTFVYQKSYVIYCVINAKSGYHRIVRSICSGGDNSTTYRDLVDVAGFWTNTSNNITSIQIITGSITSGEYWLYKLNS